MRITTEQSLISDEAVRRELWISFGSLLHSYLAATQVGDTSAPAFIMEPGADELELVSETRTVRLSYDPVKCEGYWVMHQASAATDDTLLAEGAFRVGLDSRVEWTGLPGLQEMDAVAEALVTLVLE